MNPQEKCTSLRGSASAKALEVRQSEHPNFNENDSVVGAGSQPLWPGWGLRTRRHLVVVRDLAFSPSKVDIESQAFQVRCIVILCKSP